MRMGIGVGSISDRWTYRYGWPDDVHGMVGAPCSRLADRGGIGDWTMDVIVRLSTDMGTEKESETYDYRQ